MKNLKSIVFIVLIAIFSLCLVACTSESSDAAGKTDNIKVASKSAKAQELPIELADKAAKKYAKSAMLLDYKRKYGAMGVDAYQAEIRNAVVKDVIWETFSQGKNNIGAYIWTLEVDYVFSAEDGKRGWQRREKPLKIKVEVTVDSHNQYLARLIYPFPTMFKKI